MTDPANFTIDRRRFLFCATASIFAPAVPAWSAVHPRPEDRAEPLSVGYWQDAEDPARLPSPETFSRLIPASSLPAGDPRLASRALRITIHGLDGTLESSGIRSAALQVRFRCEGGETVDFNPWSFSAARSSCLSRPLDFVVPVDGERGLDLALELGLDAAAGGPREFVAHLGLGRELRQPKLREGYYVIPLRQQAFRRAPVLAGLELYGGEPCLVLSVEAGEDG